jgi:hypothetical protein
MNFPNFIVFPQILWQEGGDSGGTWYRAQTSIGHEGLVSRNMIQVTPVPWFKSDVDRNKAETLLGKSVFLKFIVRPHKPSSWFLSYKLNQT